MKGADQLETALGALLDNSEFHELDRRLSRFNVFEAVGGVRGELRHSNFLAYLLSPARPHGLGTKILEHITRAIIEAIPREERPIRSLELALADLDDAVVHRERDNIDLLIEIPSLNLIVVIENKIGAAVGPGQLQRYKAIVDGRFAERRRVFVLLTPEGREPGSAGWSALSYHQVAQILDSASATDSLANGPRFIIGQYVEMLRRHVVPDEDLRGLAMRLYEQHQEAFDFVFEARPQPKSLLDELKARVLGVVGLEEDRSHGSNFRFYPTSWDKLSVLKCDSSTWTRTGRGLLFEAKINPNTSRVHVALVLGPCSAAVRSAFYEEVLRRPLFKGVTKPLGRQWTTVYNRELLTPAQALELDYEQRVMNVGLAWSDFQATELGPLIAEVETIAEHLREVA